MWLPDELSCLELDPSLDEEEYELRDDELRDDEPREDPDLPALTSSENKD